MGQARPISLILSPKQDILFLLDTITNSGANTPATLSMCNSCKDGALRSRESCAGQTLQRRILCKQTQRLTGKAAHRTARLKLFGDLECHWNFWWKRPAPMSPFPHKKTSILTVLEPPPQGRHNILIASSPPLCLISKPTLFLPEVCNQNWLQ